MPKNIYSKLAVSILLISICFCSFKIRPAMAVGTIYIRVDGSINPSAVPLQRNGNAYTLTGNIASDADGIVVEKDNIVVDGSGFAVGGTGAYWSSGIYLGGKENVTIKNINIKNFYIGISLNSSSEYDGISGNNITNNWRGIMLLSCSNNTIDGNNITDNENDAVWLGGSSYNRISENTITNSDYGICLDNKAENNRVSKNNIANNNWGIVLNEYSSNNTIFHNNFIGNRVQAYVDISYFNIWDDGYPSGGNYWSDYDGTEFDAYGIGSMPYFIDPKSEDKFPLKNPYWPVDTNRDQVINIVDITVVTAAFGCKPGDAKWNPVADLDSNDVINIVDVAKVAKEFGKEWV